MAPSSPDTAGEVTPDATVQVADDVWRVVLPTPFPVGPVNVYLIDDDPLTLIDTGPIHAETQAALEAGLAACGHAVEDLGRVVVSHQHIDHWGLAGAIAQRSGAEVCALEPFGAWLAAFPESLRGEDRFAEALLVRHGLDSDSAEAGVYRGDATFGAAVTDTRPLRDGDVLAFAHRTLRVLHRPGHSPSDTVFHDEERGVMLGADHVMQRPSVPILSPPLTGVVSARRPRALADQRASLRLTAAMDIELILPGHGDVVVGHRHVIDGLLRRYDRMTERVYEATGAAPRRAIDIAADVRGGVAQYAAFFILCDILGCLDDLIDDGAVVEGDQDGVAHFARAR